MVSYGLLIGANIIENCLLRHIRKYNVSSVAKKLYHRKRTLPSKALAIASLLAITFAFQVPTAYAWNCLLFPCVSEGRMTGGGFLIKDSGDFLLTLPLYVMAPDGTKVTFGFELHCNIADRPNNLEVNWKGDSFHLKTWEFTQCYDDPISSPYPPSAAFDTLEGNGHGRLNGVSGAFVYVQFQDRGEPGINNDIAHIVIYDADGTLVMDVIGPVMGGDIQAHDSN